MSRSNYAVSDFLVDRHPAKEEPFGNGINAKENTIAFGQRAIPKLIELLKVPDLNVKEKQDALKNILSLDLAHQETKIYAVQQGLIESMRDCIYDSNPIVKAQAIEVIGKLSTLRQAQERIAAEQVIPLLLDALNDVANVSIAACNTLQKLSTTHNACLMLIKYKTVSHMIPIIANSTVDATLARSLETIVALTSASDDAIADALACDILPALQKVVTSQPELVMKCCSNLAKHMKGKEALVKANMLPICAHLLHHKSHFVQQRALSAIMLLCIVVDAKKQACEIPMLIDHLVYILVVGEDGHELDVQYAKATLILLNEYPRGRAEVERCVAKYSGEKEPEIRRLLFPKATTP